MRGNLLIQKQDNALYNVLQGCSGIILQGPVSLLAQKINRPLQIQSPIFVLLFVQQITTPMNQLKNVFQQ
jgi:hypothetical protein